MQILLSKPSIFSTSLWQFSNKLAEIGGLNANMTVIRQISGLKFMQKFSFGLASLTDFTL